MKYKLNSKDISRAILLFLITRNPELSGKECKVSFWVQENDTTGKIESMCEVEVVEGN